MVLKTEYGLFSFNAGSRKHTGKALVSAARQAPAAGLCLKTNKHTVILANKITSVQIILNLVDQKNTHISLLTR